MDNLDEQPGEADRTRSPLQFGLLGLFLLTGTVAAVCSLAVSGGPGGLMLAVAIVAVTLSAWLRSKEDRISRLGILFVSFLFILSAIAMSLCRWTVGR